MNDIELALLRSLAIRPMGSVSPLLQPVVVALRDQGYADLGPNGWTATEKGCITLEQMRPDAKVKVRA